MTELHSPKFFETSLTARKKLAEELAEEDHIPSLNPTELRVRQDSGELLYLLDVHVLDEYQAGHSTGAHFCPDSQVALLTESPVAMKNTLYITVCRDRAGANIAVAQLAGAGYPNVSTLDGGTTAWIQDCHPLETGAPKEICFGQRVGMAFLLQRLPAGVERQVLPIFGLVEASARAEPLTPRTSQAGLTAGERPTLPDVCSAGAFPIAHAPDARWLSRGKLDIEIDQEVPNETTWLAMMCRKGNLSPLSFPTLQARGYQHISILHGGYNAGHAADRPTVQDLGD